MDNLVQTFLVNINPNSFDRTDYAKELEMFSFPVPCFRFKYLVDEEKKNIVFKGFGLFWFLFLILQLLLNNASKVIPLLHRLYYIGELILLQVLVHGYIL